MNEIDRSRTTPVLLERIALWAEALYWTTQGRDYEFHSREAMLRARSLNPSSPPATAGKARES